MNSSQVITQALHSLKFFSSKSQTKDFMDETFPKAFIDVILSPDSTGPKTLAALVAIEKFLQLGIMPLDEISLAITRCKFVPTDPNNDEVVLMKILQVIREIILIPNNDISDQVICEMIETCFSMSFQMRLSEILRKFAESTVICITRVIIKRLELNEQETFCSSPYGSDKMPSSEFNSSSDVKHQICSPTIENESPVLVENQKVDETTNNSVVVIDRGADRGTFSSPINPERALSRESQKATVEKIAKSISNLNSINTKESHPQSPKNYVQTSTTKPFGLPAAKELLRFIVALLNPHNHHNTETMRIIGLNVLQAIFEFGGSNPCFHRKPLFEIISNDASKNLLQLIRMKYNSPNTLFLALRCTVSMFHCFGNLLLSQKEFFLSLLIQQLSSNSLPSIISVDVNKITSLLTASCYGYRWENFETFNDDDHFSLSVDTLYSVGGTNEISSNSWVFLILEALIDLSREKLFAVDTFVNYDCDLNYGNIFENLFLLACRGVVLPKLVYKSFSGENESSSYVALPNFYFKTCVEYLGLISLIFGQMLESVIKTGYDTGRQTQNENNPKSLLYKKARKILILKACHLFNSNEISLFIAYLLDNNLITNSDPPYIAEFLFAAPKLNKKVLGLYLSKPQNMQLMQEYMNMFVWKDLRIDEALRMILEKFRLPGEAQQIQRVVEAFSSRYYNVCGEGMKNNHEIISDNESVPSSPDAVFVLAYAIIMLNTDQHNPQVRRRMQVEDFIKNLRGTNDGKDFQQEYLKDIYEAIKLKEIIMPEEHEGHISFDYLWREVMLKTKQRPTLRLYQDSSHQRVEYDCKMFSLVWKVAATSIIYTFNTSNSHELLQKAVSAYYQLCSLAFYYGKFEILDQLVISVFHSTTLLHDQDASSASDSINFQRKKFRFSVSFVNDVKAQIATMIVFKVINEFGNGLRRSWKEVALSLFSLYSFSLLPLDNFGIDKLCRITSKKRTSLPKVQENSSLFSALSSFLLSTSGPEFDVHYEPTEEEIDADNKCKVIVSQLYLERLFLDKTIYFSDDCIMSLFKILFESCSRTDLKSPMDYDNAMFLTELGVKVALATHRTDIIYNTYLKNAYSAILSDPSSFNSIYIKHIIVNLCSLGTFLCEHMNSDDLEIFRFGLAFHPWSECVCSSLLDMVTKFDKRIIIESSLWSILIANVEVHSKSCWSLLCFLVSVPESVTLYPSQFSELVEILGLFLNSAVSLNAGTVAQKLQGVPPPPSPDQVDVHNKRALECLGMLHNLVQFIPVSPAKLDKNANNDDSDVIWTSYCLPVFSALCQQCCHPNREVRQLAITLLQRTLMLPRFETYANELFTNVLFPLLDTCKSLKEVYSQAYIDEIRIRVTSLLSKVFLNYLTHLKPNFENIWGKIIAVLKGYHQLGEEEGKGSIIDSSLSESVLETLKNMVLVMEGNNAFWKDSENRNFSSNVNERNRNDAWDFTWENLKGIISKETLFPQEQKNSIE